VHGRPPDAPRSRVHCGHAPPCCHSTPPHTALSVRRLRTTANIATTTATTTSSSSPLVVCSIYGTDTDFLKYEAKREAARKAAAAGQAPTEELDTDVSPDAPEAAAASGSKKDL